MTVSLKTSQQNFVTLLSNRWHYGGDIHLLHTVWVFHHTRYRTPTVLGTGLSVYTVQKKKSSCDCPVKMSPEWVHMWQEFKRKPQNCWGFKGFKGSFRFLLISCTFGFFRFHVLCIYTLGKTACNYFLKTPEHRLGVSLSSCLSLKEKSCLENGAVNATIDLQLCEH